MAKLVLEMVQSLDGYVDGAAGDLTALAQHVAKDEGSTSRQASSSGSPR